MTMRKMSIACCLAIAVTSSFAGNCYQLKAGGQVCKGGYATGFQSDCTTPCSTARAPDKKGPSASTKKDASASTKKEAETSTKAKEKPAPSAMGKEGASAPSK